MSDSADSIPSKTVPSAPPADAPIETESTQSTSVPYPVLNQNAPPYPTDSSSSNAAPESTPPYPSTTPSTGYPGPPPLPSYHDAINYPTAAPYGQPAMNNTFPPKPYPNMGYPAQQPTPYPAVIATGIQNHSVIGVREAPGSQPTVVVQVNGGVCRVCGGTFKRRLSILYILCLIGLCLFAFPLALIFLCFLPCAHSYSCSVCGRSP